MLNVRNKTENKTIRFLSCFFVTPRLKVTKSNRLNIFLLSLAVLRKQYELRLRSYAEGITFVNINVQMVVSTCLKLFKPIAIGKRNSTLAFAFLFAFEMQKRKTKQNKTFTNSNAAIPRNVVNKLQKIKTKYEFVLWNLFPGGSEQFNRNHSVQCNNWTWLIRALIDFW